MKLAIRYFASIREALGARDAVEVADGITVGAVRDVLIARGGSHAELLARGRGVRCALNLTLADETEAVADGDELAFFPPVTGG